MDRVPRQDHRRNDERGHHRGPGDGAPDRGAGGEQGTGRPGRRKVPAVLRTPRGERPWRRRVLRARERPEPARRPVAANAGGRLPLRCSDARHRSGRALAAACGRGPSRHRQVARSQRRPGGDRPRAARTGAQRCRRRGVSLGAGAVGRWAIERDLPASLGRRSHARRQLRGPVRWPTVPPPRATCAEHGATARVPRRGRHRGRRE